MRFAPLIGGVMISAAVLGGCKKDETIAGKTTPETVWTLLQIDEVPVSAVFTIQFGEDGAVFGQADCNRYRTTQSAPLPWVEFGPVAGTRALCPNAELEVAFYQALEAAEQAEVLGDTLLLSSDTATLTFRSSGTAPQ